MNGLVAAAAPKAVWYLTRGSGAVSLVLLSVAVLLGITTSMRWSSLRWPRFVVEGLHRNISLLSTIFIAIHVATAVADGYVALRWIDVIVPFASAYKPLWIGLGAVAIDLLIAVIVTSLLRVHLGQRVWRAVHWLAYACWPVAVVHAFGTGSDGGQAWMLGVAGLAVASVVGFLGWRLTTVAPTTSTPAPATTTTTTTTIGRA